MGDLNVTCYSGFGRNRRAGELIARGATADEAAAQIGQVVEGLTTAPVLRDLSHRVGVELPITEGVCRVLGGESLDALARQPDGTPADRRVRATIGGDACRRRSARTRSPARCSRLR